MKTMRKLYDQCMEYSKCSIMHSADPELSKMYANMGNGGCCNI